MNTDLIGFPYPIKDQNGQVMGVRAVTKMFNLGNYTGYVLFFDEDQDYCAPVLISFTEAEEIRNQILQSLQTIYNKYKG